ncbi:DUF3298 and DUF4163 domain-containing protein [[Clostridium] dakarense]|uniref:DUF3298 and DUF4163 domain-containing protein n=1 Tax=Faecalimicrobium dakarense TaxID=1301100 RepID=UPI0004B3BC69|nr:DUF3298 and DUF4163 domain-containing protein [[Clostridium] dakarense]
MLAISKYVIEDEGKLVRYNINYPVIKHEETNDIIKHINQSIYEDIKAFKDIMRYEVDNSIFKISDHVFHAITEYRVAFNHNNIISIPIEFSQLIGLYDITYVNSYNYDISLEKEIKLRDIFKTDVNYIDLINNKILEIIENIDESCESIYDNEIVYSYESDGESIYNYDDFLGIDNNQIFYIEEDGITISFSSYEMSERCSCFTEFKILFDEYKDYLSEYTINNIYKKD